MPFFPPNRWRIGLVNFVGTAALTALHSWQISGWAYGDLAAATAEFRQALLVAGIFVAGVAALVGGGISRPTLAFASAGSMRRGWPLVRAHVSFLFLTAALGMTAGLTPTLVAVLSSSSYGSLGWATIISGYAGLLFYLSAGYLVGCLLPQYVAVPMTVLGAYLLLIVMPPILSPVFTFDVISGQQVPPGATLVRILFFSVASALFVGAACAWLRRRSPSESRSAVAAVAVLVLPLLIVVWSARSYDTPLVEFDDAAPVCEEAQGLSVCVHPARATLLQPWFAEMTRVWEAFGTTNISPPSVVDATLGVSSDGVIPIQLQGHDRDRWLESAVVDVVSRLTGVDACIESGVPDQRALDTSGAAGAWVLEQVGADPNLLFQSPQSQTELEELLSLDVEQARTVIAANLPELAQCRAVALLDN